MTKQKDMIIQIADHYGYDAQSRVCIEELSELITAISKLRRNCLRGGQTSVCDHEGTVEYRDVIGEIADVQIMLWQMEYLMSDDGLVNEKIYAKLSRQLRRIEKESGGDDDEV